MSIQETKSAGIVILRVAGRLDAVTAPEMETRLGAVVHGGARRAVVDLAGVDYVSSAGLRALLAGAKTMQQAEGKLSLAAPTASVRPVLEMAGFPAIIPLFETVEEACASYAPPPPRPPRRPAPLGFAEEIYLLALDERDGLVKILAGSGFDYALAGALLMDLALRDRIDTDLATLKVTSPTPTGDSLLDETLALLQSEATPQPVAYWLKRIAEQAERLQDRILARLVDKGILKTVDERILWVFEVRRYPVADDQEVEEVRGRLRDLLLGTDIPDPRDVVLISLGKACRLLDELFTRDEAIRVQPRIDALSRLDLIGRETADAIEEIERAVSFMAMPMM